MSCFKVIVIGINFVLMFELQECAGGDGKGDGVYEKDVAYHGDVLLHKFKKRLSRSPQQIVRWVFF